MTLHNTAQVVVAMFREQAAGEFHCTQTLCAKLFAQPAEFVLDESLVESGVMRNEHCTVKQLVQLAGNGMKHRGIRNIFVRYSRKQIDGIRNVAVGINERLKFLHNYPTLNANHRNINDAPVHRVTARRFDIDNGERFVNDV